MRTQEILFGDAAITSQSADAARLVLRVSTGLAMAFAHGNRKVPPSEGFVTRVGEMGFPFPEFFAWMAGFAEFGGGLLIAIGLLTRPMSVLLTINMVVVYFLAHAGDAFGDREKGFLFGFIALFFAIAGAGRYSVDALIRGRRRG